MHALGPGMLWDMHAGGGVQSEQVLSRDTADCINSTEFSRDHQSCLKGDASSRGRRMTHSKKLQRHKDEEMTQGLLEET